MAFIQTRRTPPHAKNKHWLLWAKLVRGACPRAVADDVVRAISPYRVTAGPPWAYSVSQPRQCRHCHYSSTKRILFPVVGFGGCGVPRSPAAHVSESYTDPVVRLVKFPVCLESLAYRHGQFSTYEPEVRCSNFCAPLIPKLTVL